MANNLEKTAMTIAAVGAVNWGLTSLMNFNVVARFVPSTLMQLVYGAIGIAGVYTLYIIYK